MHMADALIVPAVAGTMYAASGAAAAYSIYKVRQENAPDKIPVMGVMGAFVFAAQMINFTIPGTGSSGHLCGGLLLSAILGPYAGFLTMIGVLLVQCLFFADGGLLALGCNIWNMAFYGCFVGALLIWKNFMKNGSSKGKITLASIIGCVVTLQMGAFSVCVETYLSGISELPFGAFLAAMLPIHLAIGNHCSSALLYPRSTAGAFVGNRRGYGKEGPSFFWKNTGHPGSDCGCGRRPSVPVRVGTSGRTGVGA